MKLNEIIEGARQDFRDAIMQNISATEGLSLDQYARYLSMQYYLTNGVQKHFLAICSHPSLSARRRLRDFLYNFALEEEPHFEIAHKDLVNVGGELSPCPLDVKLWWAYFDTVLKDRPFLRLGATCVLENISSGSGKLIDGLISKTKFLNPRNTRFVSIHKHEDLPHGDQILAMIDSIGLNDAECADLVEGASYGRVMFMRMLRWAFTGNEF